MAVTPSKKSATKTTAKKTTTKKTTVKTTAKKAAAKKPAKKTVAKKTTTRVRKVSAEERYKLIEVAAYYIAEQNNFAGSPVEYWVAAEAEINKKVA